MIEQKPKQKFPFRWAISAFIIMWGLSSIAMFMAGFSYYKQQVSIDPVVKEVIVEVVKEVEIEKIIIVPEIVVKEVLKVVYRYPNTPPYEAFSDPIDYDQALVLLYGMRESHVQALNWEFESDPGFGIADKDLQKKFIKDYDQLIDFIRRLGEGE